jgi:hypothetical protein
MSSDRSKSYEARFRAANASNTACQRLIDMQMAVESAPLSIGRGDALLHVSGHKLPASSAIRVKCWDCSGHYVDGRQDCRVPWCPLYPWMPYGTMRKERSNGK